MTTLRQPLPYYPNSSGVYILSNATGGVLYVGRSIQLCRRVSHLTAMQNDNTNPQGFSHIKAGIVRDHQENQGQLFVEFIECENQVEKEKELIAKHNPPWNKA
jgi:excinuclease UvrABC nuclease subunit